MTLRIGSLCSGYEGLGRAIQSVIGGDLAWVADNDPGAAAILAHRFPAAPNLGDLTAVDWAAVQPVDVLCAGFPCQDVSAAGKRAGLQAGNRSGLWLTIVGAVAVLRPPLIVIENVRGLLTARGDDPTPEHLAAEAARDAATSLLTWLETAHSLAIFKGDIGRARQVTERTVRVLGLRKRAVARCAWHERRLVRAIGTVLGSLAGLGYDARWQVVSAADAGAPHRRERVFIVAWPAGNAAGGGRDAERLGRGHAGSNGARGTLAGDARGIGGPAADAATADEGRWRECRPAQPGPQPGESGRSQSEPDDGSQPAADAQRDGRPGRHPLAAGDEDAPRKRPRAEAPGPGASTASDSDGGGRRPAEPDNAARESLADRGAPADAYRSGRQGPEPTEPGPGWAAAAIVGRRPADEHCPAAADPGGEGREGRGPAGAARRAVAAADVPSDPDGGGRGTEPGQQRGLRPAECEPGDIAWGAFELAVRRWEHVTGRAAPRPTEPGRTGERLSPAFVEWMMGLPAGWVTEVPGLSRNQQLHALGNGVVWQQAALALRILLADSLAGAA